MKTQKYSVNQQLIETVLAWVNSNEIAIPEIQRPFVWEAAKVRDLMDSLYQGYPIGYIIAWRNPNVRLKNGHIAEGKKILIDGQQRITAMSAAILGKQIINKDYKKSKIIISFNPIEEKFEVCNSAIEKDKRWIDNISPLFNSDSSLFNIVKKYVEENPETNEESIWKTLNQLVSVKSKQIGMIELDGTLDIETVTDIFIRINSQGVVLSQSDFAMSKIASNETYNGNTLRKCIDYFCHLAISPEFYNQIIEIDKDFTQTEYFSKLTWLKNENDDLYDPSYTDLLRVAFTSQFERGRLSDLVSLLSGRNFETRTFEEEIAEKSFAKLKDGVLQFINENNFKNFIMIIKSAGFVDEKLVRSQNTLNFAYILYLKLHKLHYPSGLIEKYVKRWFVMSILTGRYSGSPESVFDTDIRRIASSNFDVYLNEVEEAHLSDAFWNAELIQKLRTSIASSPIFNVFLAAQCKFNDRGFLSKDITVRELVELKGDIHHIFPKDYLKKQGLTKGAYNQIANYVYMQSEVNIKVGNKSPKQYFTELIEQCNSGNIKYGAIENYNDLVYNLQQNSIPESVFDLDFNSYNDFLEERRLLMSKKIREYYFNL